MNGRAGSPCRLWGLSAVSTALEQLLRAVGNLFPSYYSGFFAFLSVAFGVLAVLVYLIAIICSIVAILRVAQGPGGRSAGAFRSGLSRLWQEEASAHARTLSGSLSAPRAAPLSPLSPSGAAVSAAASLSASPGWRAAERTSKRRSWSVLTGKKRRPFGHESRRAFLALAGYFIL